jgi:hypothetical protein
MCLREQIDLHMAVQPISCLIVYPDTETSVAYQRIEPGELQRQLFSNLVRLLEIFQVALPPLDLADVTKLL